MISKNIIKFITSLHDKKFRAEHGIFIVEGMKMAEEIASSDYKIHSVYGRNVFFENNPAFKNYEHFEISEAELKKISALFSPNKVLIAAHIPNHSFDCNLLVNDLTLLLDGIKDPGNMGTIIRIADWFGIKQIVCSEDCVDVFNPKVVQASMGSIFRVKVFHRIPVDFITEIREKLSQSGGAVYASHIKGDNLFATKLKSTGVIIIGSESHGVSENLLQLADKRIFIPPYQKQGAKRSVPDSLNAAIATALICAQFRQIKNTN